jgi:hypothetical protein
MTRARADRLARLVAATLGLLACRRPAVAPPAAPEAAPPAPALGPVILHDLTESADAPTALDLAPLQDRLRARLLASRLFAELPDAAAAGSGAVVRLHGEIALDGAQVEDRGVARATVHLKLDTRPSDAPGAIEEDLAGEGEQVYPIVTPRRRPKGAKGPATAASPTAEEKRALFAKLVERVASDLIDGFTARERLRTANPAAIHAALRSDGGDLQEPAIRIAGERKLRDEVPILLELLDNPNESVRDAALGALIQIGDRRAVTTLTKSRSLRDRREMRKILEAIATLGGDEALDYLSFVAASHEDEEIRAIAAAAKGRLERRERPPVTHP